MFKFRVKVTSAELWGWGRFKVWGVGFEMWGVGFRGKDVGFRLGTAPPSLTVG